MRELIAGLWLLAISVVALAQGPGGGPPPASFNACSGRAESAACAFEAPHGRVSGTCRTMRDGRPACVPGWEGTERVERADGMDGRSAGGGAQPGMGADIANRNPGAKKVVSLVPDTGQGSCFDSRGTIRCPAKGEAYYGQDAHFAGAGPTLVDNADGTVSDRVTGLQWQKAHNATRVDYFVAKADCRSLRLGGHADWRLPTIKELFSIADFRGSQGRRAFIDDVFEFRAPGKEVLEGDRFAATHTPGMMGQTWSDTIYTGVHFGRPGVEAAFFFNFLDGHIKQAPTRGNTRLFHRCVRGPQWGRNRFVLSAPGEVRDDASGLSWQARDDGTPRTWPEALAYCEALRLGGHDDWRLPNVKELEGIVDYSRHAPALDTHHLQISDPKAWFWSSTTHGDNIRHAAYVCFGPCTSVDGIDVHGAGAQRSDPKEGNPASFGSLGGQRDEVRIRNYVRCVR